MAIHIEIHIGENKPEEPRRKSRKGRSLRQYYNYKSRHPLQPFTHPQPAAGNARFGVPLAFVALLGGLSSYALAGRPVMKPDFAAIQQQHASVQELASVEQLAAIAPAAGIIDVPVQNETVPRAPAVFQVAQAEAPQPEAILNKPEAPAEVPGTEDKADVMRIEPLSIEDLEPFWESRAIPIPPRPVSARSTPASRVVSVQKNVKASDYEAEMVAAERALKDGQTGSAEMMYASLQSRNPKDPRSILGLAVAHQKAGRTDAAMALYEEILQKYPGNVDATVNYLGLLKDKNPDEAYSRLQKLWGENTHNPSVAAQLALSSARVGDVTKAMQYMGIAIALEPQNASHIYNLAVMTDQQGAHAQAMAFYKKALEVDAIYGNGSDIPRNLIYDRIHYLRSL